MIRINKLKTLENVNDYYFITTCSKVLTTHNNKIKFLKHSISNRGYKQIVLTTKIGKHKYMTIHRLVAMAFIQNKKNKEEVNHINEIKTDNNLYNLEWVTRSENMNHNNLASRNGLNTRGDKHGNAKPKEHYKNNNVTRNCFKAVCRNRGWDFNDFSEVFSNEYYQHKNHRRQKKFFYM